MDREAERLWDADSETQSETYRDKYIERDRVKDTGGETKREKRDKEITIESDRLIKTA